MFDCYYLKPQLDGKLQSLVGSLTHLLPFSFVRTKMNEMTRYSLYNHSIMSKETPHRTARIKMRLTNDQK